MSEHVDSYHHDHPVFEMCFKIEEIWHSKESWKNKNDNHGCILT